MMDSSPIESIIVNGIKDDPIGMSLALPFEVDIFGRGKPMGCHAPSQGLLPWWMVHQWRASSSMKSEATLAGGVMSFSDQSGHPWKR